MSTLPRFRTGLSGRAERLALGASLIVSLTFVVPALSIVLGIPALVFVVLAGLAYGVAALAVRQVLAASVIAVIVTAGFSANVPLASDAYLASIPGSLGPELLLVQLPLALAAVVILLTDGRDALTDATLAEILLAGFVGWSVLAALFGATARTDVALYYSVFIAQTLVILATVRYVVYRGVVRFRTVVEVFAGAVVAQSVFAIGQFLNGGTFGLSTLGESGTQVLTTFALGPFGMVAVGEYISGFTSGQFILASLIVLAVPILFALGIETTGWWRGLSLAAAVVTIAVLRATAGDAARGGLLVAGALFALAVAYRYRGLLAGPVSARADGGVVAHTRRSVRSMALTGVVAALSLAIALYPSADSGTSSVVTDIAEGERSGATAANASMSTTTTTAANTSAATATPSTTTANATSAATDGGAPGRMEAVQSLLQDLSVPYFSLTNLGVRLQQYLAGIDLFVQYPLFGIGGMNFHYYATEYGLPQPMPLHNMYIAILAETGAPGLVLYGGMLLAVLYAGVQVVTDDDGPDVLAIGVVCGIVGFLAFGAFDILQITKSPAAFSFAILAGAIVGQSRTGHATSSRTLAED